MRRLRDDPSLASLAAFEREVMSFVPSWPVSGQYFPLEESGLALDQIAYCNVVRCRTLRNRPPRPDVTSACIDNHLGQWLDALAPRVVIFIGKWAWERGRDAVASRSIPHDFLNRQRSLSTEERLENRARVAQLVRASCQS